MKKLFTLTLGLLFLFGLASCDIDTKKNDNTPEKSETQDDKGNTNTGTDTTNTDSGNTNTDTETPKTESNNIIHGHGAPNNSEGQLYSLYVDDDTNKIYEKNASYAPSSSVKLVSRHINTQLETQQNDDGAKWIYTNCLAGENFNKESSIGDAIRSTLLSTNITLKCTLGLSTSSQPTKFDVVTYVAYNYGNVLQKQATSSIVSFDDATLVGYSTYNIDSDSYRLFLQSGQNLVEHTDYINSSNPMERSIASNFVNRCLNNNMENVCNFALCDTILKELDNFTVTDRVYNLNKTINVTSSTLYDALYGAGNYYLEFKNIEFKLNEALNALEYFKFTFGYGKNDKSEWLEEEFLAEISNLRTTYFEISETQEQTITTLAGHTFVGKDLQEKSYTYYDTFKEAVLTQVYDFKDDGTYESTATKTFHYANGSASIVEGETKSKGTYTQNGTNFTITTTQIYDSTNGWQNLPEQYITSNNGVISGNDISIETSLMGTPVHIIVTLKNQ